MIDLAAVGTALTTLGAAGDIAKAMVNLRDVTKVQEKAIELQRLILEAQSGALDAKRVQSELLDEIRQLKGRLAEIDEWKEERDRYELVRFPTGSHAYQLRQDETNGQPMHHICAHCFEKRERSVLNEHTGNDGWNSLNCPNCTKTVYTKTPRAG